MARGQNQQSSVRYAIRGVPAASPPACPGVYRFLDHDGKALYIGKSVNMRSRVRSHLSISGQGERQRRLVRATAVIDCQPTAGEAGALLLENLAIKRETPIFNRRQRAMRRMWSIVLDESPTGYLRPEFTCFSLDNPDLRGAYGSFASRYHARKALTWLARTETLCPRILDLERGRGPCFQRQLGRCHGACEGVESAARHNHRLHNALVSHRLSIWPVAGPVLLCERESSPTPGQPAEAWHLLHNWMYLGTYESAEEARESRCCEGFLFDRDTYRILRGILRQERVQLYCRDTLAPIDWPGSAPAL